MPRKWGLDPDFPVRGIESEAQILVTDCGIRYDSAYAASLGQGTCGNDQQSGHAAYTEAGLSTDFEALPGRIFLDTCVVNLWLDYGPQIHDGLPLPTGVSDWMASDIEALRQLALTGQRAHWQLAISPLTYLEIAETRLSQRANDLSDWFWQIWSYWREVLKADNNAPSFGEVEEIRLHILSLTGVSRLADQNDRVLLCDAVAYQCDVFCTRDWSTILRGRETLRDYPIPILTPSEWWARIQPWAALWA